MIARMQSAGVPESVIERFPAIDASDLAPMAVAIHGDRAQRWAVEQRGFWVHGATDLAGYLHAIAPFTLDAIAGRIQCPTLITMAESDPLAASAGATYDAIRSPKTLIRFETADGADAHCEMNNRTLHDQRAFDWLDGIIGAG